MSLMMLLALGGRRNTVTQTFTSSTSWVAPSGVTRIDTLVGKGGEGEPGGDSQSGYAETITTTYQRRDGGTQTTTSQNIVLDGSPMPTSYCDPPETYCNPNTDPFCTIGSTVYSSSQTCYAYHAVTFPGDPASRGAAATGFGKTFPGGAGGAATPVSYANVAVTPGQSYPLVIPSGGSITITYQQ